MPRYCLFGDTVNTSSRMESNGRAGHIHLSKEAHDLLVKEYQADYETQPRGEVIIKGKGVMETFWLTGRRGAFTTAPSEDERVEKRAEQGNEQHINKQGSEETVDEIPPLDLNSDSIEAIPVDPVHNIT
ncbi:hypothetical protein COOONC_17719 [Cooperia oncophora]